MRLKSDYLSLLLCVSCSACFSSILYVDGSAKGKNNGENWENAFVLLQDALKTVASGGEIHIARGIYYPDHRDCSFIIPSNVRIIGGFSSRDDYSGKVRRETILSGDIDKDDGIVNGMIVNNYNNCYRVALCENGSGTYMENITFSSAYGVYSSKGADIKSTVGGGLYAHSWNWFNTSTFELKNCKFENNFCSGRGAAFYFKGSICKISNTEFFNNHVITADSLFASGGAVYIQAYGAEIVETKFDSNTSLHGAAITFDGVFINFDKCIFNLNRVYGWGGAIYFKGEKCCLYSSVFNGNTSTDGKGGSICFRGRKLIMKNCSATKNSAAGIGGVLDFEGDTCIISNSMFVNNTSGNTAGVARVLGKMCIIDSCSAQMNSAQCKNGGAYVFEGDCFEINNSTFRKNKALKGYGGTLQVAGKRFSIYNSVFEACSSLSGGAVYCIHDIESGSRGLIINNTLFKKNFGISGGALSWMGNGMISSSTFERNYSQNGGAIYKWVPEPADTVFYQNGKQIYDSTWYHAAIDSSKKYKIHNSVFRNNSAENGINVFTMNTELKEFIQDNK